ncbi:MAG: NB-ARC domain-containing protein [Ignavibacteria bacterium]
MKNKPTGLVTFLFTDIEGSTKLSQEFPVTLQSALEIHHRILQKAIKFNNGFVFEIIGDAFCAAFKNSDDAVRAAVDSQKGLVKEIWTDAVIKSRMGIHSGNAEWNGKNYKGYITLTKTEKIMSAAYGDQIIISGDSFELIKKNILISDQKLLNNEGDEISFTDLGERRLKDVTNSIKLLQVSTLGLKEEFPPLKTLDSRPNNLPVQLTSFIGKEKEIKIIKKLIAVNRLVTLFGPGGTGKTRLSLQVAAELIDRFENGVWLIELAPISDPELIAQTIANSLGINEQPDQNTIDTLYNYLKDKELLLILDNCEHLVTACAEITEKLLQHCPKLKIIATSREAFRCEGEHTYNVTSLTHPDPNKEISSVELSQFEAVKLFIERALEVNPGFKVNNENAPALAQICYQLDGIPFAIELAAARTKVLPVEKICEKLADRFKLLTGGRRTDIPGHQTLRAMIDWSYDLLSEKEKILLQRLSVFSGGWTLEAAERICEDEEIEDLEILDLNSHLLDKSIISAKESSVEIRFFMLESIKEYAGEKLEEKNNVCRRHFDYFKKLSVYESFKSKGMIQLQWIKLLDNELDNLRAAIKWAVTNDPDEACNIVSSSGEYYKIKGYYIEGLQNCIKIINSSLPVMEQSKVKLFYTAGLMTENLGNESDAENYGKEGLAIARKYNNKLEIVMCLNLFGVSINKNLERREEALKYFSEALALAREINAKGEIGSILLNMTPILNNKDNIIVEYRKEALKIFKELGDTRNVSLILASLGVYEYKKKNIESALAYTEESLDIAYEIGDNFLISVNLVNLGCINLGLKQYDKAAELLERSIVIIKDNGYKASYLAALMYRGEVSSKSGDDERAIELFKESIQTGTEMNIDYYLSNNYFNLGVSYFNLKDYENSLLYFDLLKECADKSIFVLSEEKLKIAEEYIDKIKSKM